MLSPNRLVIDENKIAWITVLFGSSAAYNDSLSRCLPGLKTLVPVLWHVTNAGYGLEQKIDCKSWFKSSCKLVVSLLSAVFVMWPVQNTLESSVIRNEKKSFFLYFLSFSFFFFFFFFTSVKFKYSRTVNYYFLKQEIRKQKTTTTKHFFLFF